MSQPLDTLKYEENLKIRKTKTKKNMNKTRTQTSVRVSIGGVKSVVPFVFFCFLICVLLAVCAQLRFALCWIERCVVLWRWAEETHSIESAPRQV